MSWPNTSTRPCVQGQQRADEPDQGRLAAAVGAQDAVDLAALDAHRDVVRRRSPASLAPAPTTNRLVTWSTSSAGTPSSERTRCVREGAAAAMRAASARSSVVPAGWSSRVPLGDRSSLARLSWFADEMERAAGPAWSAAPAPRRWASIKKPWTRSGPRLVACAWRPCRHGISSRGRRSPAVGAVDRRREALDSGAVRESHG